VQERVARQVPSRRTQESTTWARRVVRGSRRLNTFANTAVYTIGRAAAPQYDAFGCSTSSRRRFALRTSRFLVFMEFPDEAPQPRYTAFRISLTIPVETVDWETAL
jgi:hypothetical protein